MEVPAEASYHPPSGFVEDKKDPLIDIDFTDSTELWLIQWPISEPQDFDRQQLTLNLKGDGNIGTLEGSSGKSYDVVSLKSQGPETNVFLSSMSEAKFAGKISRRVALIHYPEPSELQRRVTQTLSQRSSMATSTISGLRQPTPTHSIKPKNSHAVSGYSTPSSKSRSTVSGFLDPSNRKRKVDSSRSMDRSTQDSGKGDGAVTSTGSMEQSQGKKSKKTKRSES